jgi:hypothetical protein
MLKSRKRYWLCSGMARFARLDRAGWPLVNIIIGLVESLKVYD